MSQYQKKKDIYSNNEDFNDPKLSLLVGKDHDLFTYISTNYCSKVA
jgi:hypothetical protein